MQQSEYAPRHLKSEEVAMPLAFPRTSGEVGLRRAVIRADQTISAIDQVLGQKEPSYKSGYEVSPRQKSPSENRIQTVIESDLGKIGLLQRHFDAALGRTYDSQDLLLRSYNPVIDVFHIQQLRERGDKEGVNRYNQEIELNMITNLRERYKVSASEITYDIEGDDLRSELFPLEPFAKVLDRGVQYRLKHNTPEAEREGMLGEQGGWEIIRQKLTDPKTKIGTKMTAFSPPGLVEDTAYKGKFVDEYELKLNEEGKRVAKLTRYAVPFDEADYKEAAQSLNPHFFDTFDGRPWDAWMLAHPVEGSLNLKKDQIVGDSDFIPDLTSGKLLSFLNFYKAACEKIPPDYKEIALSFNTILNESDGQWKAHKSGAKLPRRVDMPISLAAIKKEIEVKGREEVMTMMGGGCPPNKGFSFSNLVGLVREPGVARYSIKAIGAERTLRCKSCPKCGAKDVLAVIRGGEIIHEEKGCRAPYVC